MRTQTVSYLLLCAAVLLAGCGQPPEAKFVLNARTQDLIPEVRAKVAEVLTENFGTPGHLVAWQQFPIDYGTPVANSPVEARTKAGWRLVEGRRLYMQHCVHCHGTSGDGNGPTARFLKPLPRDYRQGVFKFKSTREALKPSRADLVRVLKQGIPGTYMPSFVLLGDEQLELLADYVRWLSCRGELELKLDQQLAAAGAQDKDVRQQMAQEKSNRRKVVEELRKSINEEFADLVAESAGDIAEGWAAAEAPENVITPKLKRTPPTKESLARGREIFLGDKTKCADCHGPAGRGDGRQTEQFQPIPNVTPERKYEVPGLHDIWGQPQEPRNLTRGVYRGGRRPIDIFRRLHAGINGTQMPGFGASLKDEQLWDLVNYVLSIPFDGKESAYPNELPDEEAEKKVASRRQHLEIRSQRD
ncbi:MAG: c-type cytochrome [Planctomycetaceae bacterium]